MENKKLTVDEYIRKYNSKARNPKKAKSIMFTLASFIALGEIVLLFLLDLKLFEISNIAGYIGVAASVLFFVLLFIIPIAKISKTKAFETNVRYGNAASMKRYNKTLRKEISAKIVDLYKYADVGNWFSQEKINSLTAALKNGGDNEIKTALTDIIKTDIRKASRSVIVEHAVLAFGATAISQSEKLDTIFLVTSEINLIKQIITIYGFRPSDEKLLKIYKDILVSAILSYGAQTLSSNLATGIGKKIAESASSISIIGPAIETILGSTMDGLANLVFTIKVGMETKKYLVNEYHLQDILDNVDVEDDIAKEEVELLDEAKKESAKIKVKKTNK